MIRLCASSDDDPLLTILAVGSDVIEEETDIPSAGII